MNSLSRVVQIELRSAYGHDRVYPKNLTAFAFCSLTGRKTLSDADLRVIQELGFELEWVTVNPILALEGFNPDGSKNE
jgi:hypothetical protein